MARQYDLMDPNTWELVAEMIQSDHSTAANYSTADWSHCVDMAQEVCSALHQLQNEKWPA